LFLNVLSEYDDAKLFLTIDDYEEKKRRSFSFAIQTFSLVTQIVLYVEVNLQNLLCDRSLIQRRKKYTKLFDSR